MYAEFFKDENGFIWLFYCRNAHFRMQDGLFGGIMAGVRSAGDIKAALEKEKTMKMLARENLTKELEVF